VAFPPYHGRALEHPEIVARVRALLAGEWDPAGQIRGALGAGEAFYDEQAVTVVAMLATAAPPPEVQRYLRQQEQAALGHSLHPFDVRRRIAHEAWRAVRSL
jgi:hypothetical protein